MATQSSTTGVASSSISTTTIRPTSTKLDETKKSYLDLPAELRNKVHLDVLDGRPAIVTSKGRLSFPSSALCAVCQQVRTEFLSIPDVSFVAKNFDFRRVVTSLNRLPEETLETLTTSGQNDVPRQRKLVIQLSLRETPSRREADLLKRWINRVAHNGKRGVALEVRYTIAPEGSLYHLHHSIHELNYHCSRAFPPRYMHVPADRGRAEFDRIVALLNKVFHEGKDRLDAIASPQDLQGGAWSKWALGSDGNWAWAKK